MRYTIEELNAMEGRMFEYAVADLMFHNGFRNVSVTQGSGDYGIDILARRKDVRYAI
jgi:restriction system protein